MLAVDNISKSYGPQILFRKATFSVDDQARIGIVGPNGAGKSTFFRMLVGEEKPDTGDVRYPRNYRVGLLRQEWIPNDTDTTVEAALRENRPWWTAREKVQKFENEMAHNHSEEILEGYQKAIEAFGVVGGYNSEQRARELLAGLGFKAADFDRPAHELSGGWRIRCHLAGLLLQEPELLLLDEPTNHLDVETVVWLENFLLNYPNAIMIISHDRRLIQRVSKDILEFAPPSLTYWPGNLTQYENLKDTRIAQLEAEITNKEREIEKMQDFVRRFRAQATKARQAQSRLRNSEAYEEEVEKLRESMPVISRRPAKFKLKLVERLPRKIIEITDVEFGYQAGKPLFELDRCMVEGGQKIGIIGVNGVGKSTFLKTCAGELPILSGKLERSDVVSVGYFAQHRMEELPKGLTVIDYLYTESQGVTLQDVRHVAASLGLSGNDVEKPLDVLSGGERARVSLTKILLRRPGLLLLDEPTNHLDLEACKALVAGLSDYEGTVLVVSHNRDFLDSLCDRILEIEPGKAHFFHGNYTEWFAKHVSKKI